MKGSRLQLKFRCLMKVNRSCSLEVVGCTFRWLRISMIVRSDGVQETSLVRSLSLYSHGSTEGCSDAPETYSLERRTSLPWC